MHQRVAISICKAVDWRTRGASSSRDHGPGGGGGGRGGRGGGGL